MLNKENVVDGLKKDLEQKFKDQEKSVVL